MSSLKPSGPNSSPLSPSLSGGTPSNSTVDNGAMGRGGSLAGSAPAAPSDHQSAPASPAKMTPAKTGLLVGALVLAAAAFALVLTHAPSASGPTPDPTPIVAQTAPQPAPQVAPQVTSGPQLQHAQSYAQQHGWHATTDVVREEPPTVDGCLWGITGMGVGSQVTQQVIGADQQGLVGSQVPKAGTMVVGFFRDDGAGVLAGLKLGDVIISYDGIPTPTVSEINAIHRTHHPLQVSTLIVVRDGATVTLSGPLGFGQLHSGIK